MCLRRRLMAITEDDDAMILLHRITISSDSSVEQET